MRHYSEEVLELLILRKPMNAGAQEEIRAHLKECRGCSELYEEIREFYATVEGKNAPPQLTQGEQESLSIRPQYGSTQMLASRFDGRRRAVVQWVADHKRLSQAAGTVAVIGALAFAGLLLWKGASGTNPSYISFNTTLNLIDVYNAQHEKIWHVPVLNAEALKQEAAGIEGSFTSLVTDLDGDGNNEVLLGSVFRDRDGVQSFRIYGPGGDRLFSFEGKDCPDFRGYKYPESMKAFLFNVTKADDKGKREILLAGTNGNSPYALFRISHDGRILGEYWHFGNLLRGPYLLDLDEDGAEEVILSGSNDVAWQTGGAKEVRGVIAVIKPSKIVGRTECTATEGFGFARSAAELLYVRSPKTSIDSILGFGLRFGRLLGADAEHISFEVQAYPSDLGHYYTCVFDHSLRVLQVKLTDGMEFQLERLWREKQLPFLPDSRYFEGLKNKFEYWNGREWTNEHPEAVRSQKIEVP